jgi:hypothetical protein
MSAAAMFVSLTVVPAGAAAPDVPAFDGAPERTLLVRYHTLESNNGKLRKSIEHLMYQPRSFAPGTDVDADPFGSALVDDAGNQLGWDVLTPPRNFSNVTRNPWLHFTLARPAKAAIVWRSSGAKPGWLGSWSRAGGVVIDGRTYPVFTKSLAEGAHTLGGPATSADYVRNYLVLLAEENGSPTPDPLVPSGKPVIEPNTLCPQWLHDTYTTTGPDGDTYATWHPQVDPTYWCYFGHDHGSKPGLIPGSPKVPYQYVAAKVPQNEPNVGFKEFIFTYKGRYVRIVEHASTAMSRRVCARFHTMYVMVYDADGEELFRTGFKADFGAAISAADQSTLTGSTCGYSMEAVRVATNAFRRIRRDADSGSYEVWRTVPTSGTTNLGLVLNHTLDIRDPYSFCPTSNCTDVELHAADRNQTETRRTLQLRGMEMRSAFALDTGTFHTDPFGAGIVSSDAPNAVEQYIAPGFTMIFPTDEFRCEVVDPWTMRYACDAENTKVPRSNLERGTRPMMDGDLPDVTISHPTCNGRLATIVGTAGADILVGTPLADVIVGGDGNDVIKGFGGDDLICGGKGRDRILGNGGNDQLFGDAGKDRILGGRGSDVLFGGTFPDILNGGSRQDVLMGQRGADTLKGRTGNDMLLGGPHDDTLIGDDGLDVLDGQGGTDSCAEATDTRYRCE